MKTISIVAILSGALLAAGGPAPAQNMGTGCCMGGMGRGCCMGQMAGGAGMGQRGRGPGMGMGRRGMGGGPGAMADDAMGRDMQVFHSLLMDHDKVRRSVKQLPNGVETTTESDDPSVAARIKEHVPAMYARLKQNRPVRRFDPLFAALFEHGKKIDQKITLTEKGVNVVETSTDPYVVKLIKAHAASVDEMVREGMPAMMQQHAVPKR